MEECHSIRLIGLLGITFPRVPPSPAPLFKTGKHSTCQISAPGGDVSGHRKKAQNVAVLKNHSVD